MRQCADAYTLTVDSARCVMLLLRLGFSESRWPEGDAFVVSPHVVVRVCIAKTCTSHHAWVSFFLRVGMPWNPLDIACSLQSIHSLSVILERLLCNQIENDV